MAWQTTVGILNDNFNELQNHPEEFVRSIRDCMANGGTGYAQTTIIRSHQADESEVLYSADGMLVEFGSPLPYSGEFDKETVRSRLIFKLGMLERAEQQLRSQKETMLKHLAQLDEEG